MKRATRITIAVLTVVLLFLIYIFVVHPVETVVLETYHSVVIKNLVKNKTVLAGTNDFRLGIYRPELPYQFDNTYNIENRLKSEFTIISYYQAWGDEDENRFKSRVNENLHRGGFTPLITWEPWISGFQKYKGASPDSSLKLLSTGAFDSYIRKWARNAVKFGEPFFLRVAHEVSNPWYSWCSCYGNSPEFFIKFWRHTYSIFQEEGAVNVAFVWCPYKAADTIYYPGDQYVDWIALDVFNFGSFSTDGIWMDFYIMTKLLYDAFSRFDKPIIVCEVGTVSNGGNKGNWYRDMFHVLSTNNFPLIKALVIFDTPNSTTPTGIPVDLGFSSDSAVFTSININSLVRMNITQR